MHDVAQRAGLEDQNPRRRQRSLCHASTRACSSGARAASAPTRRAGAPSTRGPTAVRAVALRPGPPQPGPRRPPAPAQSGRAPSPGVARLRQTDAPVAPAARSCAALRRDRSRTSGSITSSSTPEILPPTPTGAPGTPRRRASAAQQRSPPRRDGALIQMTSDKRRAVFARRGSRRYRAACFSRWAFSMISSCTSRGAGR